MAATYNVGRLGLMTGVINWQSTTLKVMLVKSTYIFNIDETNVAAGLTAGEVSGAGYVGGYGGAGRIALPNKTIFGDYPNDLIQLRADPITWAALNVGSVAAAVVIFETGGADNVAVPLAYINGGFPLASAGGPFTLTPAASGLLQLR